MRLFNFFSRAANQPTPGSSWEEECNGCKLTFQEDRLLTGVTDIYVDRVITSPDGWHAAYWRQRGSRDFVPVIDGQPRSASYNGITPVYFTFSSANQALYPAQRKSDSKWVIVSEAGEVGPFDRVANFPLVSPEPKSALLAEREKNSILFIDGQPGPEYKRIMPGFSCAGSPQTIYLAKKGRRWLAVVDGEEAKKFGEQYPIYPSPDLSRLAWPNELIKGADYTMVIDDLESRHYQMLGPAVFSPDSRRVAYSGEREGQWYVVIDGVESGPYDQLPSLYFSPDSRRIAQVVTRKVAEERLVSQLILDGQPGPEFDGITAVTFSPDSQRLAYVATSRATKQQTLVLDHQPVSDAYDIIGAWSSDLRFSADSRHLACIARAGSKWHLLINGKRVGKAYDQFIGSFAFDSPDSLHFTMENHSPKGSDVIRVAVSIVEHK